MHVTFRVGGIEKDQWCNKKLLVGPLQRVPMIGRACNRIVAGTRNHPYRRHARRKARQQPRRAGRWHDELVVGYHVPDPVPEAASLALPGLGFVVLGCACRRSSKQDCSTLPRYFIDDDRGRARRCNKETNMDS